MIIILGTLLCTFLSYYFACLSSISVERKMIFVGLFISFSVWLRLVIDVEMNNDYYLYFNFHIFHKPTSLLSFLINEPYLYSVYVFFSSFIAEKKNVFLAMYWFNFLITTLFFMWLLFRNDVEMWKKMVLFVFHYFLFGFVLLRNGPVYILFALYFYYTFRDKKINWIFISPFMHISAVLMLGTYFYKWRNYYIGLLLTPIALFLSYVIMKYFFSSVAAFQSILSKINSYSQGVPEIGFVHILFFLFVFILVSAGFFFYKKKMLHPILITTMLFYSITFFINPVVAHRFSPYLIFALLLFPFEKISNQKTIVVLNRLCILLLPIFVYTLFNMHKTKLFIAVFN